MPTAVMKSPEKSRSTEKKSVEKAPRRSPSISLGRRGPSRRPSREIIGTMPRVDAKALASHRGDMTRDVESIFQHGVLVDLKIGFWSAAVSNAAEDLGVDRATLAPMIKGLGTKRLVPKSMSDEWTKLVAKARYIVRRDSFLFPIADVGFVPLTVLPRVERELIDVQTEFYKVSDRLVRNYDDIADAWIRQQPVEHRPRLRRLYPPRDVLRGRFYFTLSTFTVAVPKKVRVVVAQRERMEAEERLRLDAQERYRAQLDQRVREFADDAARVLLTKTVGVCDIITTKIKKGEAITNKSLTSLRTFVDRFKELGSWLNIGEVESRLNALKRDVLGEHDADDYNDERGGQRVRGRLQDALDAVRDAVSHVSDVSSTGLAKRRVAL